MRCLTVFAIIFAVMLAAPSGTARAHAFPEKAVPGAGAELSQSPGSVHVRFDRVVEPVFSTLRVESSAGERMDVNDSHVINSGKDTLTVTLKPLVNGRYHVFWTAVARDGHRTQGDYWFIVSRTAP